MIKHKSRTNIKFFFYTIDVYVREKGKKKSISIKINVCFKVHIAVIHQSNMQISKKYLTNGVFNECEKSLDME